MAGRLLVLLAAAWLLAGPLPVRQPPPDFPGRLGVYLTDDVGLTAAEREALLAGRPVTRDLPGDPAKEVGVFGAVWIAAPPARYVAAVTDIESFERGGGFRVTRKVGDPARVEDFADLRLPDEDVADLRTCRVGDCEIKLGAEGLERIRREVDWTAPDAKARAEAVMRQLGVEYVTAYRQGGNERLAVYRDRERPTFVASEFAGLVRGLPALAEYMPDMQRYLLDFPTPSTRQTTAFVYWQEADFGLKPLIRINHVAIQEAPEGTVIASKLLYASHYFWTALEVRVLIPDPARGPGFWFVNVNRSRSDGLTGFVGRIVRGKARDGARKGMETALAATRARLEQR